MRWCISLKREARAGCILDMVWRAFGPCLPTVVAVVDQRATIRDYTVKSITMKEASVVEALGDSTYIARPAHRIRVGSSGRVSNAVNASQLKRDTRTARSSKKYTEDVRSRLGSTNTRNTYE